MRESNQKPVQSSERRRGMAMVMCLTLCSAPLGAQATATSPKIQPEAVSALRQMGTYLRARNQFAVNAVTTRDEVMPNGEKVQVAGTVEYLVRTPDRLRADVRTDRKQRQIFYNGNALTVFAPRMLMYASVAAPPTIISMLDTARQRLEIDFPLADLFLWGTSREGVNDLTSARYVGPAYVDGTDTDQYAFRQKGADWQIWIQRGNTPLPRKLVITTTSNPALPQYTATLKWNLVAKFNDSEFTFVPPKGAQRIVFANGEPVQKGVTRLSRVP